MALKLYNETDIEAIADAIRGKNGSSDTYKVSEMADAIDDIPTGGGGGNIGGLANMVDVTNQQYQLGYMLSAFKNGTTVGGTVTYAEAFPNTETLILETGLSAIHGLIFVCPTEDWTLNGSKGQSCKWFILTINSDDTYNIVGQPSQGGNWVTQSPNTSGVAYNAAPTNGTIRFSGGNIYYTGRYNKNTNYQLLIPGVQYEWLAW